MTITAETVRTLVGDLSIKETETPALLQVSAALMACWTAADAGGTEEITRWNGRINGELKARA